MASVNKVIILGFLGNDPDIKQNSSGEPIANISVATSESWKDKQTGEKKSNTEWHKVVLFGGAAKFCADYAKKGLQIYLEGKLTTRKWTDKNGVDKWTTEIVVDNFSGGFQIIGTKTEKNEEEPKVDKHNTAKANSYVKQPEEDLDDIPWDM